MGNCGNQIWGFDFPISQFDSQILQGKLGNPPSNLPTNPNRQLLSKESLFELVAALVDLAELVPRGAQELCASRLASVAMEAPMGESSFGKRKPGSNEIVKFAGERISLKSLLGGLSVSRGRGHAACFSFVDPHLREAY